MPHFVDKYMDFDFQKEISRIYLSIQQFQRSCLQIFK